MNIRLLFALVPVLVLNLFFALEAQAQAPKSPSGVELTVGFDGIAYFGDYYERNSSLLRVHPGVNFQIQRPKDKGLGVMFSLGYGQFADQYDQPLPVVDQDGTALTFVATSLFYGDLRLVYRLPIGEKFSPYVSVGAGLTHFRPEDQNGRPLINRTSSRPGGESYNATIPQLPLSLGFRYRLTKLMWLGAGYSYRFVPSDYLDNLGVDGARDGFDALHSLTLFATFMIGVEEGGDIER